MLRGVFMQNRWTKSVMKKKTIKHSAAALDKSSEQWKCMSGPYDWSWESSHILV